LDGIGLKTKKTVEYIVKLSGSGSDFLLLFVTFNSTANHYKADGFREEINFNIVTQVTLRNDVDRDLEQSLSEVWTLRVLSSL